MSDTEVAAVVVLISALSALVTVGVLSVAAFGSRETKGARPIMYSKPYQPSKPKEDSHER